jgi:hypothetical protein
MWRNPEVADRPGRSGIGSETDIHTSQNTALAENSSKRCGDREAVPAERSKFDLLRQV